MTLKFTIKFFEYIRINIMKKNCDCFNLKKILYPIIKQVKN